MFYLFHLLKEQAPTAIKKQSHNNYSYGVLFGLPVYGWNFVKVNTCFEDFFFFLFFFLWTVNHWNWQKLIWIVYVLSVVLSLVFFLLLLFCWSFKHAVVFEKCKEYLIHDFTLMVEGPAIFGNDLQAGLAQWSFCQSWDLGRMAYLSSWKNPGKLQAVHKKAKQHVWRGMEC